MTRAELLALATRVETEEPTFELNLEIHNAVVPPGELPQIVEPYLLSIDAAASLCPKEWYVDLISADGKAVECALRNDAERRAWAEARTEPQARTAAALRAMAEGV